jgi:hypothetical protein
VADPAGQTRLRDDLLRSVPGSESNDSPEAQYQVGWNGRAAEYGAHVAIRQDDPAGDRLAYLSVRMTRGGVEADAPEPFDPCGAWPRLGLTSLTSLPDRYNLVGCVVRRDDQVGSIVRGTYAGKEEQKDLSLLFAFTVRPDGTAVRAQVEGETADLDALRSSSSWMTLLDELVATLPYPASE